MVGGGEGRDWVVEERNFGGDVGGVGGGGEEGLRSLGKDHSSLQPADYYPSKLPSKKLQ